MALIKIDKIHSYICSYGLFFYIKFRFFLNLFRFFELGNFILNKVQNKILLKKVEWFSNKRKIKNGSKLGEVKFRIKRSKNKFLKIV